MSQYGTLYGIGTGPGPSDLLTLRALTILGQSKQIFAALSSKKQTSTALSIAKPHLHADANIKLLAFPMTRVQHELKRAWTQNAEIIESTLCKGQDAVFLTLGDPLLYSTFSYLFSTLRIRNPQIPIQVIPGISSFQAAAAENLNILAEGEESLHIISGICSEEKLRQCLTIADNVVILKAYQNFPQIKKVLQEMNLLEQSIIASRIGLEGEYSTPVSQCSGKPHYFSLIITKKQY